MCCKERRYFIDRRDRTWQWHIQRFRIKEPICKQYTAHKNDGGGTILAVNIFYIFHTRTSIQNACQLHSNVFIFKQPNCLKLPELLIPCAQLGTITDSKEQINDKNVFFFRYKVLQLSPGLGQLDGVLWNLVLFVFIWRLIVSLCMVKSIKSIEKVNNWIYLVNDLKNCVFSALYIQDMRQAFAQQENLMQWALI